MTYGYIFWHVQKDSFREELRDIISLSILKSVDNLSARTVCHDQKVDKVEDFGPETKVENVGWRMYDMGMTCMIYRLMNAPVESLLYTDFSRLELGRCELC